MDEKCENQDGRSWAYKDKTEYIEFSTTHSTTTSNCLTDSNW